ncbi:TPA: FAD-dependent monooxygenase [Legionella pneumophila]|nr:FAD-dependent monooxygenase [Legionella pneumophila]
MDRSKKVAIIGAGLGGLTAAILLQKRGFHVEVYERATAFIRLGAGLHLSANAMHVMRAAGVEDQLLRDAHQPASFWSRDWQSGETLLNLPLGDEGIAKYGAPYINIHRGDLHEILAAALTPGTIKFNRRLASLAEGASQTRLNFSDGSSADADVVIGADGLNSVVRAYMYGPEEPLYTDRIAHRAVFPAELLGGRGIADCSKWWGDKKHILVYYTTNKKDEVYLVTSIPQTTWDSPKSFLPCDRDEFIAHFDDAHPEVKHVVEAARDVTTWPMFERRVFPEVWSANNIVLLGDACHAMRPYMASGAATALEDAAVLARVLDSFDDLGDAFRTFEAIRVPRVKKVLEISAANTWLKTPIDPSWLFAYDANSVGLVEVP